jgi:hypothetical protein
MIVTKIEGRLGNQLFQYAFTYSVSKVQNRTYYFWVDPYYSFSVYNYFNLRKGEFFRLFFARCLYYLYRKSKFNFLLLKEGATNELNKRHVFYDGYFQSIIFFKNYEEDIKKMFVIKQKYKNQFNEKYYYLLDSSNKIAVLHVRRTDFISFGTDELGGKDLTLPLSYYQRCINELESIAGLKFLIISDDEKFVKENFKFRNDFEFENNSEIVDFQLLLNADYLVISNSTFAWWAAYLNNKKQIVYAPKYWLGFKVKTESPIGISSFLDWKFIDID